MAKKRRLIIEEPEESYEFTPTEFNEREFILKDIYGTKVCLVTLAIGIAVGIIGGLLCRFGFSSGMDYMWIFATIISFAVAGLMTRILSRMGFRPDMLETKSMIGNYLIYLALALGICIIIANPPFTPLLRGGRPFTGSGRVFPVPQAEAESLCLCGIRNFSLPAGSPRRFFFRHE